MLIQIPYIKEMQGYGADDLIGTLSQLAQNNGFQVIMVTG